ncbi:ABC transporter substrate-binding protein [Halopiger aswanensis]|uniref:NitT/TauT family transport system substrate-binding protein n=1 Tax=Halopiger aswanensis TaxID=148449 RepID=A0A3R7GHZ8_9EURY|nr:ABC transporter substrate-binding protein [Halopiger aswanensis]RKD94848.1 NitT/TauT family transport system substrate-binding protein [Halopiger aswanensis]
MDIDTQQAALDEHHDDPGDLPVMRARFEHNGSPRYLLYTIKRFGFDRDHDFHLDVELVSDELENGLETVEAKLHEGDADLIDIDYISTARERVGGAPIVAFHPYGRTVGGLVVPEDSEIEGLTDLRNCRVGVVRRLDKNWILTRAACREYHDFDPEDEATSVESGSKVELTRMLREGEVDAALQFWQIVPEIVETGPYREALPMSELVQRLSGADETLPISTFLTSEDYLAERPDAVEGFKRAYADAVERLRTDDDCWDELGERMMYEDDPAVVRGIRDGWREMVVTDWDEETIAAMEQLFGHLLEVAGPEALGVDHIPEDVFRTEVAPSQ